MAKGRKTRGAKAITARQKSARRKNIAIARKAKNTRKKGGSSTKEKLEKKLQKIREEHEAKMSARKKARRKSISRKEKKMWGDFKKKKSPALRNTFGNISGSG